MVLAPNHRILHASEGAKSGQKAGLVLVEARFFISRTDVTAAPIPRMHYYHMLFDNHQIIKSDYMLVECFFPNRDDLHGLEPDTRDEIDACFPKLRSFERIIAKSSGAPLLDQTAAQALLRASP